MNFVNMKISYFNVKLNIIDYFLENLKFHSFWRKIS